MGGDVRGSYEPAGNEGGVKREVRAKCWRKSSNSEIKKRRAHAQWELQMM